MIPRIALAVASGLAVAFAHPPFAVGWLAWIALVPLWVALRDQALARAFALGWVSGFVAFVVITWWIVTTLTHVVGLSLVAALGAHALVAAILACYLGCFAAAVRWAALRHQSIVWLAPAFWVTTEWLRGRLGIGFPWAPLGASQYRFLDLAQLAEVTGVAGLSALLAFTNAAVGDLLVRRAKGQGRRLAPIGVAVGLAAVVIVGGRARRAVLDHRPPASSLRIAVIQGNVDQDRKWDPRRRDDILAWYGQLTRDAARSAPRVVVWRETATPFVFDDDARGRAVIQLIARQSAVPLLFGSVAARRRPDGRLERFNRAYLLDPSGGVTGTYDKQVLVPFGESVPYQWLSRFMIPVAPPSDGMIAGTDATLFRIDAARVGVVICYETIFPGLTRRLVAEGANVLVNIANDGWFAGTAAVEQSLAQATFRAIEGRVPVVRVANAGVSAVIDSAGQVRWRAEPYTWVSHTLEVSWPGIRTWYTSVGDIVVATSVAASLLSLLLGLRRRRREPAAVER